MTPTPKDPVDELMELVLDYAEAVTDMRGLEEYDPGNRLPGAKKNALALIAAVEASARALAAVPAEPDALGYATRLAQAIFDKHFAHESHYASGDVVWKPLNDLLGVLTQIDNMVAGIAQQAGGVPAGQSLPARQRRSL